LEDLNNLLLKLSLSTTFTSEVLIVLMKENNIKTNNILPLLEMHQNKAFL